MNLKPHLPGTSVVLMLPALAIALAAGCISAPEGLQSSVPIKTPAITQPDGFYEDVFYGFSIYYPEDWQAEEGGAGGAELTVISPNYGCAVQVFVDELEDTPPAKEYASSVIRTMEQQLSGFQILYEGGVRLGDDVGYEYAFFGVESGEGLRAKLLCLAKDNHAFTALSAARSEIHDLLAETIDNTIYSFRLQEPFSLADIHRDESLILYGVPPITLDPAIVLDTDSALFVQEIFSGLVTLNADLEIVGDLAKNWDISDDGTVYTFYLHEDAVFHDGKPATASDFKYGMERACDPLTGSQIAGTYLSDIVGASDKLAGEASEVRGVEAIDKHTLQITIDAPKAHFLSKLLYPTAFALDRENVQSGKDWWRNPNGTGPFKLHIWKQDELLILKRNETYYREPAGVQQVVFRLWGGKPMALYEQGEIDITPVSGADIKRVSDPANTLNDELVVTPSMSINYVGFNAGEPPFDDPKIRQAFCHAIDKRKIIETLFEDTVMQADGILPPAMPGYNEGLEGLEFDPEKARQLIEQSTYPGVESLPPITYTASGRGYVSPLTEALIDMWRKHLGVEVAVRQIDPDSYAYTLRRDKDQLFDIGWLADYPDPHNFLDILFHGESGDNIGDYDNPQINAMLEAARQEMDPDARLKLYREIEQMLIDDAACLPLYFSRNYTLVKPYVKGFDGTPLLMPWLKFISLEPHE